MIAFQAIAFLLALTLRNLEEALWLPAWSQHGGRWRRPVSRFAFCFAVTFLTLLAYALGLLSLRGAKGSLAAYLFAGYALAMLLNAFFPHLLLTLLTRRYMPGTATGLLLVLPGSSLLLAAMLRQGFIALPAFWGYGVGMTLGLLLSLPFLFRLGNWLDPPT